jgi:SPP1 family predicted phage head-tail adaptor
MSAPEFSGRLNQRVQLETATLTPDGMGGFTQAWSQAASLWAEIEPVEQSESVYAGRVSNPTRWRITLRASQAISPGQRLAWGARLLAIESVRLAPGSDRQTLTCLEEREA